MSRMRPLNQLKAERVAPYAREAILSERFGAGAGEISKIQSDSGDQGRNPCHALFNACGVKAKGLGPEPPHYPCNHALDAFLVGIASRSSGL